MYHGLTILGIIPARGGSKGVPGKNIRNINGKPLIYYTIEAAKNSGIIDEIVVSTDSMEIAEISKKFGANVPFMRPSELATDEAKSMDVIIHCMNWYLNNRNNRFDLVMLLQPTSPLRNSDDIVKAVDIFINKKANAVISVTEFEHSPFWINNLPSDGKMDNFVNRSFRNENRQDRGKFYILNGAIYLAKWEYLMKYRDWFYSNSYAYIMPKERSIDIDTEFDFKVAESLISFSLRGDDDRCYR